jgi:hypothetical protein
MSSAHPALDIAGSVAKAQEHGDGGIEFRPEWKHGHGVELARDLDITRVQHPVPRPPMQLTPLTRHPSLRCRV